MPGALIGAQFYYRMEGAVRVMLVFFLLSFCNSTIEWKERSCYRYDSRSEVLAILL
jgi:hypothetical protein